MKDLQEYLTVRKMQLQLSRAARSLQGDVVVIRYEGPKGGPGMREMLNPTSAIAGMGLGSSVALSQTDVSAELPEELLSDMFHLKQQLADRSHL